ncbi:PEGA domain-containing protein, partial [Myxococcota bacterium]|nr:PEGA domain-containing protein [Myxococcota bacterium]
VSLVKITKPKGSLIVTSDVDKAEVYVDKKLMGTTPLLLKLDPGNHLVVVKHGDNKMQQIVEIKTNERSAVVATLKPKTPDVPEGLVTIITSVPGCEIFVDGMPKGKTPMPRIRLIAGQHMLEVRKKGYISQKRTVTITANQQQLVNFDVKEAPKHVAVGPLKITTETGAQIFIDGQPKGKSSVQYDRMKAGTYQIEIVKPGFKKVQKTIEVKADTGAVVHIPLERVGTLKITANVIGATIIIDNRPVGKVPLLNYELPVGTYRLEIKARDYRSYTRTIAIQGGTTEPVTLNVNLLPLGPTPDEIAEMKSSLSAFGAKVIPPKSFTASAGFDFPYWFEGKLMVGIWRKGNMAIDGGATLRTYFSMTEFMFNTRLQLFQGGPLTAGMFMDIGGGIGKEERVNFTWNLGGAGTLSFREKVNLNLSAYFNIYRDRFCLSSPPESGDGQSEPGFCSDPNVDVDDQLEGWKGHGLREPYWGIRLMFQASVEWAINTKYSVYAKLKWAAAGLKPSGTAYRPAYMDYYYSGSFEKTIIPKVDPTFYGGAGFIWKF